MPAKNRPNVSQLFPGLERRAAEARERAAEAEEAAAPVGGRGRRAVLRTQEEIEADLRALSDQEREEVLSSTHLVADAADLRDQIRYVDLDLVQPNPTQPRKHFDALKMEELVDSIRANGVLSPIHVQALPGGRYQIIAGERRWRAARKAGRTNIPVIVKAVTEQQALELALLENLQREDLSPLDEARTYRFMLDEFHYTQAQLAERIGKRQAYVSKMLSLLDLAPAVQALLAPADLGSGDAQDIPHGINAAGNGDARLDAPALLSAGAAMVLSRIGDPEAQVQLARRVIDEGLTVREVEALVRDWKRGPLAEDDVPAADSARDAAAGGGEGTARREPPCPTVYPSSYGRPDPAGPQVRFADLSVFQLYREVGRISTVDLARLEDALESDLALIQSIRANYEADQAASAANRPAAKGR